MKSIRKLNKLSKLFAAPFVFSMLCGSIPVYADGVDIVLDGEHISDYSTSVYVGVNTFDGKKKELGSAVNSIKTKDGWESDYCVRGIYAQVADISADSIAGGINLISPTDAVQGIASTSSEAQVTVSKEFGSIIVSGEGLAYGIVNAGGKISLGEGETINAISNNSSACGIMTQNDNTNTIINMDLRQ